MIIYFLLSIQMIFWGLVYLYGSSQVKHLGPLDYVDQSGNCLFSYNKTHCYLNLTLPFNVKNPKVYI